MKKEIIPLLCCPYCGSKPQYLKGNDSQADAIYCEECPLGVEHDGMSYEALATVWDGLPRTKILGDERTLTKRQAERLGQLRKYLEEVKNVEKSDFDKWFAGKKSCCVNIGAYLILIEEGY